MDRAPRFSRADTRSFRATASNRSSSTLRSCHQSPRRCPPSSGRALSSRATSSTRIIIMQVAAQSQAACLRSCAVPSDSLDRQRFLPPKQVIVPLYYT
ncbi:hypothetical protein C8F01DRAFT_1230220, partial [Mycena amicta]